MSPEIRIHTHEGAIGAAVTGLDLSREMSAAAFDSIMEAFEKYRLLVFRNQSLTTEQHVAFSQRFGELEDFPDPKDQADGFKTVLRVTNIRKDTGDIKPIDDPGHKSFTLGTSAWHIDSSFRTYPSRASALYAIEVPAEGGGTMFADTTLAFQALPRERQAELSKLTVIHDFEETRRRHGLPPRPPEVRATTPPARHPLVARRPNGMCALFIGSHAAGIDGMSYEEARSLLDELEAVATRPEFTYTHSWTAGDLVFFDNISVLHQAMPYDLTGARRLLHRTTIAGNELLNAVETLG